MDTSLPVREIMSPQVITIRPETPINEVHDLFTAHSFHHLPVMEKGKLVGMVSRTDYLKVTHMLGKNWQGETITQDLYRHMNAGDIMTSNPLKIESDDTVGLAADIFLANTFHALPVVDDDQLVGIVTSHDLLTLAYQ